MLSEGRVERNGTIGKEALVVGARELFAAQGVDAVSMREVARSAGHRNSNAVQYHFGDREALLTAVVEPFELQIGARRAALLDELDREPAPAMRFIAAALVRPAAAMLEDAEGRQHLQIVAELVVDFERFRVCTGSADNGLARWDRLAKANMSDATFPLHRRYSAISLCFNELGRRARNQRRPDHRLFVSDVVDLVTGVLDAVVSDETQQLLEERNASRSSRSAAARKRTKVQP